MTDNVIFVPPSMIETARRIVEAVDNVLWRGSRNMREYGPMCCDCYRAWVQAWVSQYTRLVVYECLRCRATWTPDTEDDA